MNKLDKQYTNLLQDILDNGVKKQDRTQTGTISVFGRQIRHDMKDGFPLLTTKKMPFKTIVTELLWFLRGDTNIKYLVDNNCHIWNGDAYMNYRMNVQEYEKLPNDNDVKSMKIILDSQGNSHPSSVPFNQEEFINKIKTDDEFAKKWGELGPIYGKQWRKWETKRVDNTNIIQNRRDGILPPMIVIDQIQNLINDLKTNPDSRRLMVNAWAVHDLPNMVLPPCHYGFQVYTRELKHKERIKLAWFVFFPDKKNESVPDWWNVKGLSMDEKNIPTRAISLMFNMRSVDTFLGLPFNIASYGLLLEIIAKEVNMVPEELIGNLGDVHLYSNHIEQAKEQIGRELTLDERNEWCLINQCGGNIRDCKTDWKDFELDQQSVPKQTRHPFPLPTVTLPSGLIPNENNWDKLVFEDFYLNDYQSHSTIKAPLSN